MEYTIITPMEMTIAAVAAATATTATTATTARSGSGFLWLLVAVLIIAIIVCTVKATREYDKSQFAKNQASPDAA